MDTTGNPAARWRGALLGLALGDAIGEIAQTDMDRWKKPLFELVAARSRLDWTDDTAMALAIAEVLAADGRLECEALGRRFHERWQAEPWRGYAQMPPTIFHLVEQEGITYREGVRQVSASLFDGRGSWGNGAAMRAAPVGLFFAKDPDLYARAEASAEPTHLHPLGIEGAALVAKAVSLALELGGSRRLDAAEFLAALQGECRTTEYRGRLERVASLLEARKRSAAHGRHSPASIDTEAAQQLGTGVAALDSAPFAMWSFVNHPESFEACLVCAAGHRGDTDTIAAMACGISGAYLGEAAIPREWKDKLEEGGYIASLATALFERSQGREPGAPFLRGAGSGTDSDARDDGTISVSHNVTKRLPAGVVNGILQSGYYVRHVGYLREAKPDLDFTDLRPVEVTGMDAADAEDAAELVAVDPILERRDELRQEMLRSGTWFHDNGEAVKPPYFIALGRHQWYVPFAEDLAERLGSEVYLLDFMVWADMGDPHASLSWFIDRAERIDVNLRGITPADLRRATSGAGGPKGSRRELGLPYMTSWEMNYVYWGEAVSKSWWHLAGGMTASEAAEILVGRLSADRIVQDRI